MLFIYGFLTAYFLIGIVLYIGDLINSITIWDGSKIGYILMFPIYLICGCIEFLIIRPIRFLIKKIK